MIASLTNETSQPAAAKTYTIKTGIQYKYKGAKSPIVSGSENTTSDPLSLIEETLTAELEKSTLVEDQAGTVDGALLGGSDYQEIIQNYVKNYLYSFD